MAGGIVVLGVETDGVREAGRVGEEGMVGVLTDLAGGGDLDDVSVV